MKRYGFGHIIAFTFLMTGDYVYQIRNRKELLVQHLKA